MSNCPWSDTPSTPGPSEESRCVSKMERAQKSMQLSGVTKVLVKIRNRNIKITQQLWQWVTYGQLHSICSIEQTLDRQLQPPWTIEGGWTQVTRHHANQPRLRPKRAIVLLEERLRNPQLREIWTWRKQKRPAVRLAKGWERKHMCPSWLQASSGSVTRLRKDCRTKPRCQWVHRETGGVELSEWCGSRRARLLSCTKWSTGWLEC